MPDYKNFDVQEPGDDPEEASYSGEVRTFKVGSNQIPEFVVKKIGLKKALLQIGQVSEIIVKNSGFTIKAFVSTACVLVLYCFHTNKVPMLMKFLTHIHLLLIKTIT